MRIGHSGDRLSDLTKFRKSGQESREYQPALWFLWRTYKVRAFFHLHSNDVFLLKETSDGTLCSKFYIHTFCVDLLFGNRVSFFRRFYLLICEAVFNWRGFKSCACKGMNYDSLRTYSLLYEIAGSSVLTLEERAEKTSCSISWKWLLPRISV